MTISKRLKSHLEQEGIAYDTVPHPRSATASESAQTAHVPGDRVAKSVVIHHEEGYVLAVVPSTHRVDLCSVQEIVNRRLGLASESEINEIFRDCTMGAVPPIGAAYGVPTLVDDSLSGQDEVYFEGGDHCTLVLVTGRDFEHLMTGARHASFSTHT